MDLKADIPLTSIPNSREGISLLYSKSKTTVGATKDSLYLIKEQKYEIKKHPQAEMKGIPKAEAVTRQKSSEGNMEQNTLSENSQNLGNPANETHFPDEPSYTAEEVSKKRTDCRETIGDHKDSDRPNLPACEKSIGDCAYKSMADVHNEISGTPSEIQLISYELNEVFKNRLSEIETQAPNDLMLQIRTYQDWTESLLKRNIALIKAKNTLGEELNHCFEVAGINADVRLRYYRDRDILVKFVQDAFNNDVWNLDNLKLETVSLAEFLKRDLSKSREDIFTAKKQPGLTKKTKRQRSQYTMTDSTL